MTLRFRAGLQSAWGNLRAPPLLVGRRPPQSNYPPDNVPDPDHGPRLELQNAKGGISPLAPPMLAHRLHSLPPILHIAHRGSLPGCSKGAQGLSVYVRVTGIFTGASDSLSPLWSQRPDRYAIRAGRNLPAKEFRYLRTVIVTAAVYWGFDSGLSALLLTFQHRAGVSPYTSPLVFAPAFLFDKHSPPPTLSPPLLSPHPSP